MSKDRNALYALFVGVIFGTLLGYAFGVSESAYGKTAEADSLQAQLDTATAEIRFFRKYLDPEIEYLIRHQLQLGVGPADAAANTRWFVVFGLQTKIPPRLLAAIAHVESRFKKGVISHKGASGIMQVMPDLWWSYAVRECGDWQRGDVKTEICAGAYVLKHYLKVCDGKVHCALSRYYSGYDGKIGRSYADNVLQQGG